MAERQLLTQDEVAEILRIEPRQVMRLARAHKLPSIKMGRYRRFDVDEIEGYIERNTEFARPYI